MRSRWKKSQGEVFSDGPGIPSGGEEAGEPGWRRREAPGCGNPGFQLDFQRALPRVKHADIQATYMIKPNYLRKLIVTAIQALGLRYPEVSEKKHAHPALAGAKLEGKPDDAE